MPQVEVSVRRLWDDRGYNLIKSAQPDKSPGLHRDKARKKDRWIGIRWRGDLQVGRWVGGSASSSLGGFGF